jgi:high-affinity K+ transport system ATPase subunit B
MITGDNRLTARSIAEEVGVDDFLAEVTRKNNMEHGDARRRAGRGRRCRGGP